LALTPVQTRPRPQEAEEAEEAAKEEKEPRGTGCGGADNAPTETECEAQGVQRLERPHRIRLVCTAIWPCLVLLTALINYVGVYFLGSSFWSLESTFWGLLFEAYCLRSLSSGGALGCLQEVSPFLGRYQLLRTSRSHCHSLQTCGSKHLHFPLMIWA
jgi:hypothetical protein